MLSTRKIAGTLAGLLHDRQNNQTDIEIETEMEMIEMDMELEIDRDSQIGR